MSTYPAPAPEAEPGPLEPMLNRLQRPALIAGLVGTVLLVLGVLIPSTRGQFFRSYLYAYLFWTGIPLGCLSILMLQNLVGGGWGLVIRRLLESGTRMLPLMAILFIPLALGLGSLYPWATSQWHQEHVGHMPFKANWLRPSAFVIRTVIYFAVWIFSAFLLNWWSAGEDRDGDPRHARRMQMFSGPGLILYVLTMTGAATDWVMSLDPDWYSTIFGVLFVVGQALSTIALMIVLIAAFAPRNPFARVMTPGLFNDLGNLLLAFTMLWAYMSFSQFLIIWAGNIAEETPYYFQRVKTPWKYVALALVIFHIFVPFALLLSRYTKRAARSLARVAMLVLVMRFVDLFWVIAPAAGNDVRGTADTGSYLVKGHAMARFGVHWLDLAAPVAIGGIWLFVFVWQLKRRPLLAPNDYRLAEMEASRHAHA